jgi:hypothetical protein
MLVANPNLPSTVDWEWVLTNEESWDVKWIVPRVRVIVLGLWQRIRKRYPLKPDRTCIIFSIAPSTSILTAQHYLFSNFCMVSLKVQSLVLSFCVENHFLALTKLSRNHITSKQITHITFFLSRFLSQDMFCGNCVSKWMSHTLVLQNWNSSHWSLFKNSYSQNSTLSVSIFQTTRSTSWLLEISLSFLIYF